MDLDTRIKDLEAKIDKQEVIIDKKNDQILEQKKLLFGVGVSPQDVQLDPDIIKLNEEKEESQTEKHNLKKELEELKSSSKKREANDSVDSPERKRMKNMSVEDICKEYNFQECSVEKIGESAKGVSIFEIKCGDYSRIIYDRECYEDYYNKIIARPGDIPLKGLFVVSGTPGTGKTTMLYAFLIRFVNENLTGILRVGDSVFFVDGGKLFQRHPMKEKTFESFVKDTIASSTTSMILLFDRPKDETGFFRRAAGFNENFPLVILAASPSNDLNKQFTDNPDNITRYSSLMKLWSDDEFEDLIKCKKLPFIKGWGDFVDDLRMMYGNIPRLIFQKNGVKEFKEKLNEAMKWDVVTLVDAWKSCSDGGLDYMAAKVSHHVMMLDPNDVTITTDTFQSAPPFMTPYAIDKLDDNLLNKHQDARVSMAYDLRLGRMFERLAFDYLQMKQLKATNLSGRKKILKIGPFKELETFDKASFGSIEPKSNKKTVWECAYEGWYAVDGFCDSCWLQMTVGSSHPITIAKTTKKNFMGFQDQYNRMKGLPKPKGKKRIVSKMTGFNDFVFVLPDFRENDFVKPQSFCNSGGTVDCPNWLKIRQYTAFIKRSDLL
eukprot:TRINITY_DN9_c0_g2_i14.p1 TRINITY_DN9_c0_g2~~TRINITY_DN9_c0_g2_i14.p1  ORF type:complete len:612 (+),score=187.96 TRINITY_DN9_c0_g2_i14:23-1837(+)